MDDTEAAFAALEKASDTLGSLGLNEQVYALGSVAHVLRTQRVQLNDAQRRTLALEALAPVWTGEDFVKNGDRNLMVQAIGALWKELGVERQDHALRQLETRRKALSLLHNLVEGRPVTVDQMRTVLDLANIPYERAPGELAAYGPRQ